jgi:uncharacterized protein YbaP (TraB family)
MNVSRLAPYVALLPEMYNLIMGLAEAAKTQGVSVEGLEELQEHLRGLPDVDEED